MVPLVRDRPLALQAFPDGIEGKGFFMKSVPKYFPDWIRTATVPKARRHAHPGAGRRSATLVYLAGQNVVTPHAWLSRADQPHTPDRLIIDFDPSPGVDFAEIRAAARDAGAAAARRGASDLRDGHRLSRDPRPLPAATRPGLHRGPPFRPRTGRADGRRRPAQPDARMASRRTRRAHLHRRQPRRLRPACGRSLRASGRGRARRWRCRSRGRSCRIARSTPDRWTIATAADRLDAEGDAWAGIGRHARRLPPIPDGPDRA